MEELIGQNVYLQNGILRKKEILFICNNMEELVGHCAKCNKIITERKLLYNSTAMKSLKHPNSEK
jgi:hypothetical protein